jgi:ankyrin repeat protein
VDCVKLLIKYGKHLPQDAFIDSCIGDEAQTPLMYAVSSEHSELCLHTLLESRAKWSLRNAKGQTALILAAKWGQDSCVRALLTARASASEHLNACDRYGQSALAMACHHSSEACLRSLLMEPDIKRAVFLTQTNELTPLMLAVMHASDACFGIFMNYVQTKLSKDEIIRVVNHYDVKKETPLMVAVQRGRDLCVKELLKADALPSGGEGVTEEENRPLAVAVEYGRDAIVELLLKHQVDVNADDAFALQSALWYADHPEDASGHQSKEVYQRILGMLQRANSVAKPVNIGKFVSRLKQRKQARATAGA